MAGITHVVYDPPVSRLPYLAVAFHPDGTLQVQAFGSAAQADAFVARMARRASGGKTRGDADA